MVDEFLRYHDAKTITSTTRCWSLDPSRLMIVSYCLVIMIIHFFGFFPWRFSLLSDWCWHVSEHGVSCPENHVILASRVQLPGGTLPWLAVRPTRFVKSMEWTFDPKSREPQRVPIKLWPGFTLSDVESSGMSGWYWRSLEWVIIISQGSWMMFESRMCFHPTGWAIGKICQRCAVDPLMSCLKSQRYHWG